MQLKKNQILIALIIIPILTLIGMSFNSIRESSIVIEREYLDALDQVSEGLQKQNTKTNNKNTKQ